jgi:hypothetical protein
MIVALSLVVLPLQGAPVETEVAAEVAYCPQQGSVKAADKENTHRSRMMVSHCCILHFCHAIQGYSLAE